MNLPDTHDTDLALWRQLLANLGGTADPTADLRTTMAAVIYVLTA